MSPVTAPETTPRVLASYLPGEGIFRSEKYEVTGIRCEDPFDYWRGISAWWDSAETILNLEHDVEVLDEHIDVLLGCSHPLCSFGYQCHWYTTHQPRDIYACGNGSRLTQCTYHQGGEEWAEWSAIGLVKITKEARIGPLDKRPWSLLELSIEDAVKRPWHVHWTPEPIHHHW